MSTKLIRWTQSITTMSFTGSAEHWTQQLLVNTAVVQTSSVCQSSTRSVYGQLPTMRLPLPRWYDLTTHFQSGFVQNDRRGRTKMSSLIIMHAVVLKLTLIRQIRPCSAASLSYQALNLTHQPIALKYNTFD